MWLRRFIVLLGWLRVRVEKSFGGKWVVGVKKGGCWVFIGVKVFWG